MNASDTATEFSILYSTVYSYCHRRQSPRAHRISNESLALLTHLSHTGPLTVKEAAAHFDRSQAATSEMIQRLIERGFVDRIQDERDRRRHLIWLSEEAVELVRVAKRMPIESGPYCEHCVDDSGELQAFTERFERMVQWVARREPKLSRPEMEAKTLEFMASMPAWKDHPELHSRRAALN